MLLFKIYGLILIALILATPVLAADEVKVIESSVQPAVSQEVQPQPEQSNIVASSNSNEVKYTLGPDDVIEINVQRHTEFSGVFPINLEGKIQYGMIGDLEVTDLTKKELEAKLKQLISAFVVNPEVTVTITEYRSKVYYVLGEVARPGKYYMRAESIPVREAIVEAGLPTMASATRKCRLITPDKKNNGRVKYVNLYSVLYEGNLRHNVDMKPGDVFYVPSTVMAKVTRVISPVTDPLAAAAGGAAAASSGAGAVGTVRSPIRTQQTTTSR